MLSAYGNVRANGINAINIEKGDELIDVQVCERNSDIVLATRDGMSIRFHESDVREMGRATTGVKGIELEKGDEVIGMVVVRRDATLLVVSEKGFGKRSELDRLPGAEARRQGHHHPQEDRQDRRHRGAQGSHARRRADDDHPARRDHPAAGGRASGSSGATPRACKVMNLDAGDTVVDVARVVKEDEGGAEGAAGGDAVAPTALEE